MTAHSRRRLLHLLTTAVDTFRTSGGVRFRAAVRGIADIQRADLIRPDFMSTRPSLASLGAAA
jgi:hypothetical protein